MSDQTTKGPWKVCELNDSCVCKGGTRIAIVCQEAGSGISADELAANVRLIAAAPTMETALRDASEMLHAICNRSTEPDDPALSEVVRTVWAALDLIDRKGGAG